MMRRVSPLLLCLTLLVAPASAQKLEEAWSVSEGIERPESAYYHAPSKTVFVTVMMGPSDEKHGQGYIAKLALDGKVKKQKWFTDVSAPKGMRVHEGTLWVSDIDRLLGIDIESGQLKHEVKPEGAQFLNDVATADDGTVYVSDMWANKVLAWKDGNLTTFLDEKTIQSPNGLLVQGDRLLVGCKTPQTEATHLFAFNRQTKEAKQLSSAPFGNLDGLESDGGQGYLVSDWPGATVTHIDASGQAKVVLKAEQPGTADIAYVVEEKLLIVPHMQENRVAAYKLPIE